MHIYTLLDVVSTNPICTCCFILFLFQCVLAVLFYEKIIHWAEFAWQFCKCDNVDLGGKKGGANWLLGSWTWARLDALRSNVLTPAGTIHTHYSHRHHSCFSSSFFHIWSGDSLKACLSFFRAQLVWVRGETRSCLPSQWLTVLSFSLTIYRIQLIGSKKRSVKKKPRINLLFTIRLYKGRCNCCFLYFFARRYGS